MRLSVTAAVVLNGHVLHMYFIIHYGDFDAVDPNLWFVMEHRFFKRL